MSPQVSIQSLGLLHGRGVEVEVLYFVVQHRDIFLDFFKTFNKSSLGYTFT